MTDYRRPFREQLIILDIKIGYLDVTDRVRKVEMQVQDLLNRLEI
jgi:hypothetical protein